MKRASLPKAMLILALLILIVTAHKSNAQDSHQLNFSVTLSGHILMGVGYTYSFDRNWQAGATAFIAPEKGFPFAFNVGGGYLSNGRNWKARWWGEFMLIASPPDPEKRKFLPLINFVPGVVYFDGRQNEYSAEAWLSFLPIQKKFAPTGLEIQYGRHF